MNNLLRQRRTVNEHGVLATGFGDQRANRAVTVRQRLVDRLGHPRGTRENHTGDARVRHAVFADHASAAGDEVQHIRRHAGLVQQLDGAVADQRGGRRRLGQHGIAGGQRSRDLPRINRQREVPGANRDKDALAAHAVGVSLARRARQHDGLAKVLLRLRPVVAHEIDRFAQFGYGVGDRAPALADDQPEQFVSMFLVQVGGTAQYGCAFLGTDTVPGWLCGDRQIDGLAYAIGCRLMADTDDLRDVGRIHGRFLGAVQFLAADDGLCRDLALARSLEGAGQVVGIVGELSRSGWKISAGVGMRSCAA